MCLRINEGKTMSTPTKRTGVLVLIAEKHLDRLSKLVEKLKRKGLHITNNPHDPSGVVTGTIAPDKVEDLKGVEGVEDVLPDEEKRIAPSDSPIQ
jgi:hypothetical protein